MQTNNQIKPDKFRVGDTVWCLVRGKGTVVEIDNYGTYPVKVQFPHLSRRETYTVDGRLEMTSRERTLFFSEPKVEASVTRPFVPTLVGKNVLLCPNFGEARAGVISEETTNTVVHKGITWNKTSIISIYEISSENLLKP